MNREQAMAKRNCAIDFLFTLDRFIIGKFAAIENGRLNYVLPPKYWVSATFRIDADSTIKHIVAFEFEDRF